MAKGGSRTLRTNAILDTTGMKSGVDRAIAEQRRLASETGRINRQMASDHSRLSMTGGGGGMMGSLGGRGMIMGQARYAASSIGGMAGGGLGLALRSVASLNPYVLAISAGIGLIANEFKKAADRAKELEEYQKAVESYRDRREAIDKARNPQLSSPELDQARTAYADAKKQFDIEEAYLANPALTTLDNLGHLEAARKRRDEAARDMQTEQQNINNALAKIGVSIETLGRDRIMDAQIAGMDGPEQRRAQLAEQHLRERRTWEATPADQTKMTEAALNEAQALESANLEADIERKALEEKRREGERLEKEQQDMLKEYNDRRRELQLALMPVLEREIAMREDRRKELEKKFGTFFGGEIFRQERELEMKQKQREREEQRDSARRSLLGTIPDTPDQIMENFTERVLSGITQKYITGEEGANILEHQLSQMMPKARYGQFEDSDSRWKNIQSAIVGSDDTDRLSLKAIQETRDEIARLRQEGVKIKAGP